MKLKEKIAIFEMGHTLLKAEFSTVIKDKTIPLDERWELFKSTPMLHGHDGYIVHFEAEKLLPTKEISWYDDMYVQRNETVNMVSIIEGMEDCSDPVFTPEIIIAFKEEILEKNLGTFIFDW